MENKKYLDLEGLNYYHGKLVDNQITPLSGEIDLIGSNLSEYKTTTDATIDGIENTLGNKVDYSIGTVSDFITMPGKQVGVYSAASSGSAIVAVASIYDPATEEAEDAIIRSTDGNNWEIVEIKDAYQMAKSVAYGNGIFFTEAGMSADNGITWKQVGFPIRTYAEDYRGVCYDNGKFYSVFDGGTYGGVTFIAHNAELNSYGTLDSEVIFSGMGDKGSVGAYTVKDNIAFFAMAVGSYQYFYYADLSSDNPTLTPCTLSPGVQQHFADHKAKSYNAPVIHNGRIYLQVSDFSFDGPAYATWFESADGINWETPSEIYGDNPSVPEGFVGIHIVTPFEDHILVTAAMDDGTYNLYKFKNNQFELLEENTIHTYLLDWMQGPFPVAPYVQCAGSSLVLYGPTKYGQSKGIESSSIIGLGNTIINQINQTVVAAEEDEISGIFG